MTINVFQFHERQLTGMSYTVLWMFDVLLCPLSAAERFLLQPLVCGTVFHRTSLLRHVSLHLIPLSDSSLICTLPTQ